MGGCPCALRDLLALRGLLGLLAGAGALLLGLQRPVLVDLAPARCTLAFVGLNDKTIHNEKHP